MNRQYRLQRTQYCNNGILPRINQIFGFPPATSDNCFKMAGYFTLHFVSAVIDSSFKEDIPSAGILRSMQRAYYVHDSYQRKYYKGKNSGAPKT